MTKGDELLPRASASTRRRNPHLFADLPSGAERQPSAELFAPRAYETETYFKGRCSVRVTSLRRRLIDQDNVWVKHHLDALCEAGILVDDGPNWCQLEVHQVKVSYAC